LTRRNLMVTLMATNSSTEPYRPLAIGPGFLPVVIAVHFHPRNPDNPCQNRVINYLLANEEFGWESSPDSWFNSD
jgi:hypothetical protein